MWWFLKHYIVINIALIFREVWRNLEMIKEMLYLKDN
jgi:hypothetical protein